MNTRSINFASLPPLIARNCWRNPRRTVLTLLSLCVSMCLLGVLVAMYHAFYVSAPTPGQARRLAVRNRINITAPMPNAYEARIAGQPGVREVMMSKWFGGTYKDNRDARNQFARFIVEPEKLFTIYGEWRIPEDQKRAFERNRTGAVIGRDLANNLGFKVGDRVTLTGDLFPGQYEVTISGIYDSQQSSNVMYFNKEYVEQSRKGAGPGAVSTGTVFWVLIDNPADSSRIAAAIDSAFRNSTAQTKTESEQAFVVGFLSVLGNVKMFLLAISAALVFTILLVSANTVAMSVRERTREMGVLKTLGFTPGALLTLILGEALAITLVGALAGYILSTGLLNMMVKSPFAGYLPPIQVFEPTTAAACLLVAGALGLASSLTPAIGVVRLPITAALRSSD